jgi:hypothetical protein
MSDQGPDPQADREARSVARALERLEVAEPLGLVEGPLAGQEEETLLRLHTETLGVLPYALEPRALSAALKGRILAALAGGQGAGAPAPRRPVPPATEMAAAPHVARPRPSRWPLRLAAALATALLGAGLWLFLQNQEQSAAIARLEFETRRLGEALSRAEAARESVALLTSRGVEVCPLRPGAGAPPAASGALFVAADHQHWYLAVQGLLPCPAGRRYQLWFHTAGGTVPAGTFDARPGETVELRSPTMPAGTRAVSITLEAAGGAASPTGPRVLYGEDLMRLL